MSEAAFLAELSARADCLLLLDVNNVFVSSFNHGFDAENYFDALPTDRVAQIHVAGHTSLPTQKIDTHDAPVCDEVWSLFAHAHRKFGPVPAMIERDDAFPPFADLLAELQHMREIAARVESLERAPA
jgi:uncharacterized protein (UPF0276 family)